MVKELAKEALSHFESRERDGEEIYVVSEDAPYWVHQMAHHAHDGMMPDDWRYKFIASALSAICDGDFYGASLTPSDYTYQLANWLSSDGYRISYCDDAIYDGITTAFSMLQSGQLLEIREVHGLVRQFLEELALSDDHASLLGEFYEACS